MHSRHTFAYAASRWESLGVAAAVDICATFCILKMFRFQRHFVCGNGNVLLAGDAHLNGQLFTSSNQTPNPFKHPATHTHWQLSNVESRLASDVAGASSSLDLHSGICRYFNVLPVAHPKPYPWDPLTWHIWFSNCHCVRIAVLCATASAASSAAAHCHAASSANAANLAVACALHCQVACNLLMGNAQKKRRNIRSRTMFGTCRICSANTEIPLS